VDVMDSECSRARLRSSATLDVLWSEEIIIGGHPGREQQPQNGKHPTEQDCLGHVKIGTNNDFVYGDIILQRFLQYSGAGFIFFK
jgi:hypothetical protein